MSGSYEQGSYAGYAEGQVDPQGIGGALLGGLVSTVIGNKVGGPAGKLIKVFGKTAGAALIPFSAEPEGDAPTELEVQCFQNVMHKMAVAAKTAQPVQKIPIAAAQPLSLLATTPPAAVAGPTELELQGFFNVVDKLVSAAKKAQGIAKKADQFGHAIGLLDAGVPESVAPPTALELQGFVDFVKKIAKHADKAIAVAKTAGQIGHSVGLFEAQPSAGQQPNGEIDPQQLLQLLREALPALTALAEKAHPSAQPA